MIVVRESYRVTAIIMLLQGSRAVLGALTSNAGD